MAGMPSSLTMAMVPITSAFESLWTLENFDPEHRRQQWISSFLASQQPQTLHIEPVYENAGFFDSHPIGDGNGHDSSLPLWLESELALALAPASTLAPAPAPQLVPQFDMISGFIMEDEKKKDNVMDEIHDGTYGNNTILDNNCFGIISTDFDNSNGMAIWY